MTKIIGLLIKNEKSKLWVLPRLDRKKHRKSKIIQWFFGAGLVCTLTVLSYPVSALPNTGDGPETKNCKGIARACGAWKAKGENTCRSCKQALCKEENGKEVLAGTKTETECYEGHGEPPQGAPRSPRSKFPIPLDRGTLAR